MKKLDKLNRVSGVSVARVTDGRWRVRLGAKITGGKPLEKKFAAFEPAAGYVEDWLQQRRNRASAAAILSDAQLEDARKAFEILENGGFLSKSLASLADDWLEKQPRTDPWTVAKTCDEFVDHRERVKRVSHNYLKSLAVYHRGLKAEFGGDLIHEVSKEVLEDYLDDQYGTKSAKTYNHNLGQVKSLWAFAKSKGKIVENVTESMEKRKEDFVEVGILSPEDLYYLLETAKETAPELVIPWALQAFAGLRRSEACKITWGDIKETQVVISARVAKTSSRRVAPVLPPLRSVLAWAEIEAKPKDKPVFIGTMSSWNDARLRVLQNCQVGWPKNCLRHSFVSYRLAALHDDARVALEAGHSVAMLHEHYKSLVEEDEARKYWELYQEEIIILPKRA